MVDYHSKETSCPDLDASFFYRKRSKGGNKIIKALVVASIS